MMTGPKNRLGKTRLGKTRLRKTRLRRAQWCAALMALIPWFIPLAPATAAQPPEHFAQVGRRSPVLDVALQAGGTLHGQLFDAQAQPLARSSLVFIQNGQRIASVTTDDEGRFQVAGLRGGTLQIVVGVSMYICRAWAPRTAPPIAKNRLVLVLPTVVQRGQRPISDAFFGDPVMIGLVVAAAIAVPIAVSNSRSDAPPGS